MCSRSHTICCTTVFLVTLSSVVQPLANPASSKRQDMSVVLSVIQSLSAIAAKNRLERPDADLDGQTRARVGATLGRLKGPDQLYYSARFCKAAAGTELAEDRGYDRVFDAAYERCVSRLSRDISPGAVFRLSMLDTNDLDGSGKLLIKHCIEQQLLRVTEAKRIRLMTR